MKIQLVEKEIIAGLQLYLNSVGINTQGQEVKVEFTSTRKPGSGGLVADVDINFIPVVTAAYAPEFRDSGLGDSTVALHSQTNVLLSGAVVDAPIVTDSTQTADTIAVTAAAEDVDQEVHASGSILDEVLLGIDQEKEEDAMPQVTATSALFDQE